MCDLTYVLFIHNLCQPALVNATGLCMYGQMETHARSMMQHDVADKSVYSHKALHYQSKWQVAKWDYSDSDKSEESK